MVFSFFFSTRIEASAVLDLGLLLPAQKDVWAPISRQRDRKKERYIDRDREGRERERERGREIWRGREIERYFWGERHTHTNTERF